MRILITGGAGCLGSNLIEHYHPKGHEICVIDNFATGNREVVPEVSGLQVVEGSVSDYFYPPMSFIVLLHIRTLKIGLRIVRPIFLEQFMSRMLLKNLKLSALSIFKLRFVMAGLKNYLYQ